MVLKSKYHEMNKMLVLWPMYIYEWNTSAFLVATMKLQKKIILNTIQFVMG